jgi:hypothetical protein
MFGGNQLAVFLEPQGLTDVEMQAIARELNLAETTFVSCCTCCAATAIFGGRARQAGQAGRALEASRVWLALLSAAVLSREAAAVRRRGYKGLIKSPCHLPSRSSASTDENDNHPANPV